jgi:hypothetical protein
MIHRVCLVLRFNYYYFSVLENMGENQKQK